MAKLADKHLTKIRSCSFLLLTYLASHLIYSLLLELIKQNVKEICCPEKQKNKQQQQQTKKKKKKKKKKKTETNKSFAISELCYVMTLVWRLLPYKIKEKTGKTWKRPTNPFMAYMKWTYANLDCTHPQTDQTL